MALEYTLAMVKPDAVSKGHSWHIIQDMASSGLKPVALRMTRLTKDHAKTFYAVHAGKKFFESLTDFMSSGPILALVLEGDNAIKRYRDLMGATDSRKAAPGTLRAKFGTDVGQNAVHGSDSPENVRREAGFFFSGVELSLLGIQFDAVGATTPPATAPAGASPPPTPPK
jgi:nucleoside-diphosphate kinase